MPMKGSGVADGWQGIDRFADGLEGFGWIAYPGERMQRASHALAAGGDVYLVDPVDAPGLDDRLADLGEVAGVVVLLDRHRRDAAALAGRHDAPVYLPDSMRGLAGEFAARTETTGRELADTGIRVHTVIDNPLWTEAVLHDEDSGTLVVPEALGTSDYFLAGGERVGVHPALRMTPPSRLRRFDPERLLVGHGEGVLDGAGRAVEDALAGARSRAPKLYAETVRSFLPV